MHSRAFLMISSPDCYYRYVTNRRWLKSGENGRITADGKFRPVPDLFEDAFREMAHELLMIQAEGDYEAAVAFVDQYGAVNPAMETAINGLVEIPVDIDPSYPFASGS